MDFCNNCNNYLSLKEILENDERILYYYCNKCEIKKQCLIKKISFKKYKIDNDIKNEVFLNKYKVKDKTLPQKYCKCPKCKKMNNNRYEVHYKNNSYNINIICKNCFNNFIF